MNPITRLRDIVPQRPLNYLEARQVAERQATRMLADAGIKSPSVPERIITEVPKIRVSRTTPFPTSGASHWYSGEWLVVLNAVEPITRQRFSLAHEFKHIIDHRFSPLIYGGFPKRGRDDMIEQLCDYFAACLLMPRPWVKRLYCQGLQHLPDLAQAFGVSQAAMSVRLSQIGLIEPTPRCLPVPEDLIRKSIDLSPGLTYLRRAVLQT